MKFTVHPDIFQTLPTFCAGVVVAKGCDNSKEYPKISALLDEAIETATERFTDVKVKESPLITPYREAFRALDINPNKFQCSVEAMFMRISKGKGLPHINPLVDLNNAISLSYTLPMGTHDLSLSEEDIEMRPAAENDTFLPFGEVTQEDVPAGEVVYAVGHQVRTRRWTWRQSEYGKIDPATSYVFFPIDGFTDFNADSVKEATAALAAALQENFGCQIKTGFVDKANPSMDLTL